MKSKKTLPRKKKPTKPKSPIQRNLLFHIGNGLIVLSLVGIIATFAPLVRIYFWPPESSYESIHSGDTMLEIPKIKAIAPILIDIDPFRENIYQEALKKGVAHAKGTKLPGEVGTVFLFAHSSGAPWELTRYNTIFFRLGELEKDDQIVITFKGNKLVYTVTDKKIVWPNEVTYLNDTRKNELIIQTCYPIGTSLQRLLVFARPS